VDRLKGLDVGIVVSRNLPPEFDVQARARALFPFEEMEFGENEYMRRDAGYRMRDGARVGIAEWYHPDPLVNRVLRQYREAESSQAIDRFRLIYRDTRAVIYILSQLPLDITVDALIHDPLSNPRLLEALERSGWVLPLVSDWLHERMPELFKSAEAARQWIKRLPGREVTPPRTPEGRVAGAERRSRNGNLSPMNGSTQSHQSSCHSPTNILVGKRHHLGSQGAEPRLRSCRFRLRKRHHTTAPKNLPRVLTVLDDDATIRRLNEHFPGDEVIELTDSDAPSPLIRIVDHTEIPG
jgi:hypothetical protein